MSPETMSIFSPKVAARFDALVEKNALLEWAEVFDNYYGTPAKPVMDALATGHDVLFDIDWQGTQQLRGAFGTDLVRIFAEARIYTVARNSSMVRATVAGCSRIT